MSVFENLMEIDDRSIQLILREVQSDSLIIALKGAPPELREKIFKNMSTRAAETTDCCSCENCMVSWISGSTTRPM